jgi:hypothetical protein
MNAYIYMSNTFEHLDFTMHVCNSVYKQRDLFLCYKIREVCKDKADTYIHQEEWAQRRFLNSGYT